MADVPLQKGYINRWKPRNDPRGNRVDYWFCEFAKNAAYWDTEDSAQRDCSLFQGMEFITPFGTYICRDFHVEQFGPNQYVVWCEAPFAGSEAQGQKVG
jgi:hypothetical protein